MSLTSDKALDFLIKALQLIIYNQGNPQIVFRFLQANQELLNDDNLAQRLQSWAKSTLPRMKPEEAQVIATGMLYFGNILQNPPFGRKANCFEIAIACYESAVELVHTRFAFPEMWAANQGSLGAAYMDRKLGDKDRNIGEAIKFYQRGLSVYNYSSSPELWASLQHCLGNAYLQRSVEEGDENIEQAIKFFQNALTVFSRKNLPVLWASSQLSLGGAYYQRIIWRIVEEPIEDFKRAVEHSQNALEVYTPTDFPELWARTQNNLGLIYKDTVLEEKPNLEQAIKHFEKALEFYNRTDFPKEWADIQAPLGEIYADPVLGERKKAENFERAIEHCQNALQVYTRTNFPKKWAAVQEILGQVYVERVRDDQAQNVEMGIKYSYNALEIYTRADFPNAWARVQINLGNAYRKRLREDQSQNQELAIVCYNSALQVITRTNFPEGWARIQITLSIVYRERIQEDQTQNLKQAIEYCHNALQVFNQTDFPEAWATAQNTLGLAYNQRVREDGTQSLELAIECFRNALQAYTEDGDFPLKWAATKINLAMAYSARIREDYPKNQELAIDYCEDVLRVIRRADAPKEWAFIHNCLGSIYSKSFIGTKAENSKEAIKYYQKALEVYTRTTFPRQWASIQNNLGNVYWQRLFEVEKQWERLFERENESVEVTSEYFQNSLEEAIKYYQKALEVYTRTACSEQWAMVQCNLGKVYRLWSSWEQVNNPQVIECYQNALEVYTRTIFPQQWAEVQKDLGIAYSDRHQVPEAIQHLKLALEIFTPTTFPLERIQTGRWLGNTALSANLWSEAIQGYSAAIDAFEQNRSWAISDSVRQVILAEAVDVYQGIVQACIENGQLDRAIEYVERSRSRFLVDLMTSNNHFSDEELSPKIQQYLKQYEELQQRIDEAHLYNQFNNLELEELGGGIKNCATTEAYKVMLVALEAQKHQVWEQLRHIDPVLAGQIQVSVPNFATIQQLIDQPTTAILNFYSTRNDTYIFVVRHNKITCHTCIGQGLETLQRSIFNNWLLLYLPAEGETKEQKDQRIERWRNQITIVLTKLSQLLQFANLIDNHLEDIKELILIPHIGLHYIPFAALPIVDSQYLGDKFLLRYTPSYQVLEFCLKRPPLSNHLTYGIVENATEDLPCVGFEAKQIAHLCKIPDSYRLNGRSEATINNYRNLAQKVQVIHSSHHAQSRLDNPLESRLVLGDGSITLGQLLTPGWRLPHLSDVFLSCCETNLGITMIMDDIITLSTGFLCAGARSVISTLWAVDDLATALLCIFYYQYQKQGKSRIKALQQAQLDLRTLSGETLATEYRNDLIALLDEKLKQVQTELKKAEACRDEAKDTQTYQRWQGEYYRHYEIGNRIIKAQENFENKCREACPFSHPFYWAAFTCSGLR